MDILAEYREGKKILGDDYSIDEIKKWFMDEAQGYAAIVPDEHKNSFDEYQALTDKYLYKCIADRTFESALIYGGGYGTEILPIISQLGKVTILEPGEKFSREYVGEKKVEYIKPTESGQMVFNSDAFDLITCFGVLHHVPNVSYILTEFYRVMKPGGVLLIREPIRSMHIFDNGERKGMTLRERGIPIVPFRTAIKNAGFSIKKDSLHGFGPLTRLKPSVKYSPIVMELDYMLCKLSCWNYTFDNYSFLKRFCPTEVSYVLIK